jgi:hypothetical protein
MITQFTSPKFYDKKIQDLNSKLTVLGWIQNIYPLAQIGVSDADGKDVTFPEIYNNDGGKASTRIYPSGKSLSFFLMNGDINGIDSNDDDTHFVVPLALVVWADLTKVYPAKKYNYTTELLEDVVKKLRDNSCNDITIQTDKVFEGFSDLDKSDFQNIMLPYTAFKINFNCLLTLC